MTPKHWQQQPGKGYTHGRGQPSPRWDKPPSLSNKQWHQYLQSAWTTIANTALASQLNARLQQAPSPPQIQTEWNLYMELITRAYQTAINTAIFDAESQQQRQLLCELQAMQRQCKTKIKGLPAKHQWMSIPQPTGYASHETEAARKQNKRLARLYETRRLAHQGKRPPETLLRKVWDVQTTHSMSLEGICAKAEQSIAETLSSRSRREDAARTQRLNHWKHQLAEPNGIAKWMRTKEEIPRGIQTHTNHEVAQDDIEAAKQIAQFWTAYWSEHPNQTLDHQAVGQTMANQIRQAHDHQDIAWHAPSLNEFCAAAKKAKGAAGPDTWSSSEMRCLPQDAHILMGKLFLRFLEAGCLPAQLKESRQVNFAKPGKIQDQQIDVAQTRPISVMSTFWRIFASAWVGTPSMQQVPSCLCLR